jgi:hypothetical protein
MSWYEALVDDRYINKHGRPAGPARELDQARAGQMYERRAS